MKATYRKLVFSALLGFLTAVPALASAFTAISMTSPRNGTVTAATSFAILGQCQICNQFGSGFVDLYINGNPGLVAQTTVDGSNNYAFWITVTAGATYQLETVDYPYSTTFDNVTNTVTVLAQPTPVIHAPSSGASFRPSATVPMGVSDAAGLGSIAAQLSASSGTLTEGAAGVYSGSISAPAAEGSYLLTVSDANAATVTMTVEVDATPPNLSGLVPANASVLTSASPSIAGTVVDPLSGGVAAGVSSVSFVLDGSPAAPSVSGTVYSLSPAGLADGPHAVTLSAVDAAGNSSSAAWDFWVDTHAPTVAALSPPDLSALSGSSPTVSFQLADPLGNGYASGLSLPPSVTFDGGAPSLVSDGQPSPTYSFSTSGLAQGLHAVTVTVQDQAGNSATARWVFTVDSVPPTAATGLPAGLTDTGRPRFSAQLADGGSGVAPASVSLTVDGVAVAAAYNAISGLLSYTPALALADGPHAVTVDLKDKAGNAAAQLTWTVSVDSAAPTIGSLIPADQSSATSFGGLSFQASDPVNNGFASGLVLPPSVRFDGSVLPGSEVSTTDASDPYTYTVSPGALAQGPHSVTVTAFDAAGNSRSVAWVFTVDATQPTATNGLPIALTSNAQPLFSAHLADNVGGSGVDPASVSMTVDGLAVPAVYNAVSGSLSYRPPTPLALGAHAVTVDLKDKAGNSATQLAWSVTIDDQGPSVQWYVPWQGSAPNAFVATNYAAYNAQYLYGYASDSPAGVSRVAFYIDGSLIDTAYASTPQGTAWNSASAVSRSYPNFPYPLVFWDTKTVADGSNYHLQMVAFDTLDNETDSVTMTVQVNNSVPLVNVISPSAQLYKRPGDAVDVVFDSPDPNPSMAKVLLTDPSGTVWGEQVMVSLTAQTPISSPITTSVQVMANTPDGTLLNVSVQFTNQAGQLGVSTLSAATKVLVDSSLPSASAPSPVGLTNAASPLITATLADAVSGVDPQSVSMTVDGAWVPATVTAGLLSYPAAGLALGVHHATVDLKDRAGNAANQLSWSFTVDSQGPVLSLAPLSGLQSGYASGTLTLTANASDAPAGVSRVAFYQDATLIDTAYFNPGAGTWSGAGVAGSPQPQALWDSASVPDGPAYHLYAVAFDNLGNQSQSVSQSVGVSNGGPSAALLSPAAVLYRRPGGAVDVTAAFGGPVLASATWSLLDAGGNTLAQALLSPLSGAVSPLTQTLAVPAGAPDGWLSLGMAVHDQLGRVSQVAAVDRVLVDSTPPLASHPDLTGLTGSAAPLLTAALSDAGSGVDPRSVSMTVDGAWVPAVTDGVTVSYTAAALANGVHQVSVDLMDRAGNRANTLSWGFSVDTSAPQVLLTQPLAGAVLRGSVTLLASVGANAPAGVSQVAFYDGGTLILTTSFNGSQWVDSLGGSSSVPRAVWNSASAGDGAHSLDAVAWDQAGNSQVSQKVTVLVDNRPPSLTLSVLPAPVLVGGVAQVYAATVTLKGTVSDTASGVAGLSVDQRNAGGQPVNSSPLSLPPPPSGAFSVQLALVPGFNGVSVTATDLAGNSVVAYAALTYLAPNAGATVCQGGGSIRSADGSSLSLPSGALAGCQDLSLDVVPGAGLPKPSDPGIHLVGDGTRIGPDGLVFLQLGTLVLTYSDADLDPGQTGAPTVAAGSLRAAYFDGSTWLRLGVGSVDSVRHTVTLSVNHSGLFALYSEGSAPAAQAKVFLTHNPFRYAPGSHTDFVFDLPQPATVTLKIFDLRGQRVRTLVDGVGYPAGRLSLAWDGATGLGDFVGSGVYLYRFEARMADGSSMVSTKTVGVIQ